MKKIVLLSKDEKLLSEMTTWLEDVADKIAIESISDLDTFYEKYCSEPQLEETADPAAKDAAGNAVFPAQPTPENQNDEVDIDTLGAKAERHLPAQLVIADLEMIEAAEDDVDAVEWVKQAKASMSEFGFSLPEAPTRFFLLGYGEQGSPVDTFRKDSVDDLMQKPLDKSVFLQKVEIHISDPGKSMRPSFLFKQKTNMIIEMGKETTVESVSEFGFTITNPAPLATGVFAKVYSPVFGKGSSAGIIGRVYKSEKNPDGKDYLCSLDFFGISAEQMSNVRKILRAEKLPAHKLKRPPINFEAPLFNIAVVDLNSDVRLNIRDAVETNFTNVNVFEFSSYSAFLRFCGHRLPKSSGQSEKDAQGVALPIAEKTLAESTRVSFLIDASSGKVKSFETPLKARAKILGIEAEKILSQPESWLSVFDDAAKEDINEYLTYLRSGQVGSIYVTALIPEVGLVRLRLLGKILKSDDNPEEIVMSLELKEMSQDEWDEIQKRLGGVHDGTFDILLLDASLVGESAASALDGLSDLLLRASLIESRDKIRFGLLADEKSRLRPEDYKFKTLHSFLYKPLDRKMLVSMLAAHLDGVLHKSETVDTVFRKVAKPGRVTKEVLMDELSEFGLQIRHPTPLKERSFLRFFSSVFLDETGTGLVGRCQFSVKDESGESFLCFFSFFGATDAQLKHIRKWIRGDYAARKEKTGA